MDSFVLPWVEIKTYQASVGPGVGRPYRPTCCEFCDHPRVWFNGWRVVHETVLVGGQPFHFGDGLPLQRVRCARCRRSWTMLPPFLYPHRNLAPDVSESAVLAYLANPDASYRRVAARFTCSHVAVWVWVSWLAALESARAVIAETTRLDSVSPAVDIVPRAVPDARRKGRSGERRRILLRAFQGVVALACLARAQAVPPEDPSPLRGRLMSRFLAFREIAYVHPATGSPPYEQPRAWRRGYKGRHGHRRHRRAPPADRTVPATGDRRPR